MTNVREISGKVVLADGTTSEFSITAGLGEHGWQQWGATAERLGETCELVDALTDAAADFLGDEEDEED